MRQKGIYHYFVEGDDDKKLLDTLKLQLGCIKSGKVDVLNVIQNNITSAKVRTLKPNTIVVLVYDTDVNNTTTLQSNINFLKQQPNVKKVLCIPQVNNLEDELVRACNIKNIMVLTGSFGTSNFKRDFKNCTNLDSKLQQNNFDIRRLWNQTPSNDFEMFGNNSNVVKLNIQ